MLVRAGCAAERRRVFRPVPGLAGSDGCSHGSRRGPFSYALRASEKIAGKLKRALPVRAGGPRFSLPVGEELSASVRFRLTPAALAETIQ